MTRHFFSLKFYALDCFDIYVPGVARSLFLHYQVSTLKASPGDAIVQRTYPGSAAVSRRYPDTEMEGGADRKSGTAELRHQCSGDVHFGFKKSSVPVEEEKKQYLCVPPNYSFDASAVLIDRDAAAVQ